MSGGEYSLLVVTSEDLTHPTKVTIRAFSLSEFITELQSALLLPEGESNLRLDFSTLIIANLFRIYGFFIGYSVQ